MTEMLVTARVEFEVPGEPEWQGSKTRTPQGFMREANRDLAPWRRVAVFSARDAKPNWNEVVFPRPVAVRVRKISVFKRPASHYRTGRHAGELKPSAPHWHTSVPDDDKLARALGDALTNAGVVQDDSQIAVWESEKVYGEQACTRVTVEAL